MKNLAICILVMTLLSLRTEAQTDEDDPTGVSVELSAGYSSNKNIIGRFGLGGVAESAIDNGYFHTSVNLLVFATRSNKVPAIMEGRFGLIMNDWEIYAGAGYHYASADGDEFGLNGWRPAYGLIKHFLGSSLIVGAGMSSTIFHLQVGFAITRSIKD